ncbi:MAG TPA: hypothetical protein VMU48_19395 [Terracidiphilus sp.]|nr:hypothetical protein [Terracidiphilus sp.]
MMDHDKIKEGAEGQPGSEAQDQALKQVLIDFKATVHAWSEAEFNRPRAVSATVVHRTWRLAAGWALASALVAGAVSGGMYERHQQEMAKIAAARIAEQQRELAAAQARAKADADLFAKVDTDVSQEVPDALEPLAELSAQSTAK